MSLTPGAPSAAVARLQPFGATIFAEMSELAHAHGAVNLGQGFPDWDGPRPSAAMWTAPWRVRGAA